jgi:hypothetical protein
MKQYAGIYLADRVCPRCDGIGVIPPRRKTARENGPKLNRRKARRIRQLLESGRQGKRIAKRYKVTPATVSQIGRGKIWADDTPADLPERSRRRDGAGRYAAIPEPRRKRDRLGRFA